MHEKLLLQHRANVQHITGFAHKAFHVRYLGCPLFHGRSKRVYFMEMVHAVIKKVASWRDHFLSIGGRITLIKHALAGIPIHLLAVACPLKGVFSMVERVMANFLWGERAKMALNIIG